MVISASKKFHLLKGLPLAIILLSLVSSILALRVWTRPPQSERMIPAVTCSDPNSVMGPGRVFHVDPFRGTSDGDGSAARPWKDLQHLALAGKLGEYERILSPVARAVAAISHGPPTIRDVERAGVIIRGGDTILLASGDYGAVDFSRLSNRTFVTISAAPGARVRFATLDLSGASHFVFRDIAVGNDIPLAGLRHLVTTYRSGPVRADNIVFDRIDIGWTKKVAATRPDRIRLHAPDGLRLGGDCLSVRNSKIHDIKSAVNIFRGRKIELINNTIRDFSVDGIQFSGHEIVIRNNDIFDQWATPDPLHPDCMQGQPPDEQYNGPVTIEYNNCIREFVSDDSVGRREFGRFGWQGISIFDGRWRDVLVRCNVVMPAQQNAIVLFGVDGARIENNTVIGLDTELTSWIAAMPSKGGRQSTSVLISNNRSTGYLNAVTGGPKPREELIDYLGVKRADTSLMAMLRAPITGVTLRGNTWLYQSAKQDAILPDERFAWAGIPPTVPPQSPIEAIARGMLPGTCDAV